jgi:hypothetical protein
MNKNVYWAGIEYVYTKNSPEYNKLKGGFVYAFVGAKDKNIALNKIKAELKNSHLTPVDIEFISLYDMDTKWNNEEQTKNYIDLFNESQKSDQVFFDTFYAYEID